MTTQRHKAIRRGIRGEEAAPLDGDSQGGREQKRRDDVHREGVRAFLAGEWETARRKFQALLSREEDNAELATLVGHCLLEEGDNTRAIAHYKRAEELSAGDGGVLWGRALAESSAGRPQEALPFLEAVFRKPPSFTGIELLPGPSFTGQREFVAAVAMRIADIHLAGNNREGHRYWLQAALGEDPECVAAHRRLADLYVRSRNHREAVKHLEFVLDHAATPSERLSAHNTLAIALYDIGQREEAVRHLKEVLARDPGNSTAIHNLNFIYEREGAYEAVTPGSGGELRFEDVEYGGSPIFALENRADIHESDQPVIIGKSSAMMRVMRHARVAAANDSPVLLWGESGTGKELLARMIRANSRRAEYPFEIVQCESLSDLEMESELFGHEKGAFAGARTRRLGGLELARNGTVFIEEIGELSPLMQGKLLRALNDGRFFPMGSQHPVTVQARVIAATSSDPRELVKEGRLREDLYYKLNVIPIQIPSLRERREDIPLLTDFFLARHAREHKGRPPRMPPEDLALLQEYDWPGNVRELENLVERAIVMGSQSNIYTEELARLRRSRAGQEQGGQGGRDSLVGGDITIQELERRHVLSVLRRCGNNQGQAARILGINPSTLWRKLKSWKSE